MVRVEGEKSRSSALPPIFPATLTTNDKSHCHSVPNSPQQLAEMSLRRNKRGGDSAKATGSREARRAASALC